MGVRESNGVFLSASEWRELEKLVDSDDPAAAASESPDGETSESSIEVYCSLLDKGMVSGVKTWGGFVYDGLTVSGRDFIEDCRSAERDARAAEKSGRRHDYLVALVSACAGFVLGLIAEEATGLLSGLVTMLQAL